MWKEQREKTLHQIHDACRSIMGIDLTLDEPFFRVGERRRRRRQTQALISRNPDFDTRKN
jgi:hypothetical protein